MHIELTLRMDCIVCSGYVTVVETALAIAPITKTSRDESFGQNKRRFYLKWVIQILQITANTPLSDTPFLITVTP